MRRSCGTSPAGLEEKFEGLRERGEGALMTHLYYGDPSEEFSRKLIEALVESGADILELGIPFSDPIADGPTFQAACERALKAGVTPDKCIEAVREIMERGLDIPVVLTTYFNIPYVMGFSRFLRRIREAGAQGLLIPDLPLEEVEPYLKLTTKEGVRMILQIAPTTSERRLRRIVDASSGFIYLISLEGVTGSNLRSERKALRLIKEIKGIRDIPVMVGFGISGREQAETFVSSGADGVVVGSAYARIYSRKLQDPFEALPEVIELTREVKLGCRIGYARRKDNP
ncbi:MAG: tryptophan synthase subunit alpha [Candidatus Korarchaeum sp.]|nr:tryptophan synthase subunit alpha [Candidatus Korarchaeum sp.]